jgi:small-conductance mechanosensitive channel
MGKLLDTLNSLVDFIGPYPYLQAAIIALAFILLGKVADWIFSSMAGRIARRSSTRLDDHVVELLHRPIFTSFVLLGLALAIERIHLGELPQKISLSFLKTIAIFVWYNLFASLATVIFREIRDTSKSKLVQSGMLALLQNVATIVLIALAIYFGFLAWDVEVTAWLASAGIVGLALGLAAKDTLSNVFAGVSIVADSPYKTGDFIIIDSGERGVVTHIGLRSTRLLTRDDVEVTIPNGILGNSKIINEAGGPSQKHRIRVAVGVAYGSDIDNVIATLEAVAAENEGVCEIPSPRVRFRRFGDFSLDFELLCWIDRPVDRGRMSHELNCAVYKAFIANNIEIPFPQRDLHVRTMPKSE